MADLIKNFLLSFTDNARLLTFLCSCFPLIELKGAIPVGTGLGLPLLESAAFSYLGSTIIVIPIFFLLIPVFKLLKKIPGLGRFFLKLETVLKNKAAKVAAKSKDGATENSTRKVFIVALFVFVAIPLPLTGVWTGAAIAVFLNMRFKDSILPLAAGNLVAGSIITLLTFLFKDYVNLIIDIVFVLALIMLIVVIVKIILAKPDSQKESLEEKTSFSSTTSADTQDEKGE